jgi:hypothetical protein
MLEMVKDHQRISEQKYRLRNAEATGPMRHPRFEVGDAVVGEVAHSASQETW